VLRTRRSQVRVLQGAPLSDHPTDKRLTICGGSKWSRDPFCVPAVCSWVVRSVLAVRGVRLQPDVRTNLLPDRLFSGGLGTARLSCQAELAAALPDARQGLAQLLVGDVEVSLRLLDVGVAEHQLDRADVDSVGQQSAGAFMPLMPRAA
jgi:hypothetical protein